MKWIYEEIVGRIPPFSLIFLPVQHIAAIAFAPGNRYALGPGI